MASQSSHESEAIESFPAALRALRNPDFIRTPKYGEQQTRANRVGADPDILEFERAFLSRMARMGIPFFAVYMVRTAEQQMALYKSKASRDNPADGLWPHQYGAVDLIHGIDGYDLHDVQWDAVSHIGKEVAHSKGIKIVHGRDFKSFHDAAHWELEDWKERSKFAAEMRFDGKPGWFKRLKRAQSVLLR